MLLEEFISIPDKTGLIFVDSRNMNIFHDSGLISPINEFIQEIDLGFVKPFLRFGVYTYQYFLAGMRAYS